MKLSLFNIASVIASLQLSFSVVNAVSYFRIKQPTKDVQWAQGIPHSVSWVNAHHGVDYFDLELARMGSSGLLFAAREVPTNRGAVNIVLQDVPPGTDYYVVFLNVTHGDVYTVSDMFTILPPSQSGVGDTAADSSKPTITVSGAPHPTKTFTVTLGPEAASGQSIFGLVQDSQNAWLVALLSTWIGVVAGGFWAVL